MIMLRKNSGIIRLEGSIINGPANSLLSSFELLFNPESRVGGNYNEKNYLDQD